VNNIARRTLILFGIVAWLCSAAAGQAIAFVLPEKAADTAFADLIIERLRKHVTVADLSLAASAFHASRIGDPYNMTLSESRNLGAAIGCDFFVVFNTEVQRRAVIGGEAKYEAYAGLRMVSTRTGRLVHFEIVSAAEADPDAATRKLRGMAPEVADSLLLALSTFGKNTASEINAAPIEEVPTPDSPAAKGLTPPIPYRRIKPEYTSAASLYGVAATVEILVDLDEKGAIIRTDIARWAGFGLDESVEKAVRSMTWRSAYRDGKPLPMRVLLRYNFKKLDGTK